jgi:hypothetical protein
MVPSTILARRLVALFRIWQSPSMHLPHCCIFWNVGILCHCCSDTCTFLVRRLATYFIFSVLSSLSAFVLRAEGLGSLFHEHPIPPFPQCRAPRFALSRWLPLWRSINIRLQYSFPSSPVSPVINSRSREKVLILTFGGPTSGKSMFIERAEKLRSKWLLHFVTARTPPPEMLVADGKLTWLLDLHLDRFYSVNFHLVRIHGAVLISFYVAFHGSRKVAWYYDLVPCMT